MRWAEILHGISERHLVFIRHVGTNVFIQPPKVAAESVPCLIRPFVSGTWSMQPSVNGDADFVTVSREMDSTIASGFAAASVKNRERIYYHVPALVKQQWIHTETARTTFSELWNSTASDTPRK